MWDRNKKMINIETLGLWCETRSKKVLDTEVPSLKLADTSMLNNGSIDIKKELSKFSEYISCEYEKLQNSYTELSSKYMELKRNYDNLPDDLKQAIEDYHIHENESIGKRYVSPSLKVRILKRDNYTCVWCGSTPKDGVKLHIDHIIPVGSEKGRFMSTDELNAPDNLRTLCDKCNIGKSNKLDEQLNI